MDDAQSFDGGLRVERHINSDRAVVVVSGPLAFPDAVHVTGVIKSVIEHTPPVVVLDLTDIEKVDATGVAVLVGIGADLKDAGIQVRVVASDPRIRNRLPYTLGLRKVFATVQEAEKYEP